VCPLQCIQGLGAAVQLGAQSIIMETDAKQIVEAVQGSDFRLSVVGGLVHEVKELLVENFLQFQVSYAPRDCVIVDSTSYVDRSVKLYSELSVKRFS